MQPDLVAVAERSDREVGDLVEGSCGAVAEDSAAGLGAHDLLPVERRDMGGAACRGGDQHKFV